MVMARGNRRDKFGAYRKAFFEPSTLFSSALPSLWAICEYKTCESLNRRVLFMTMLC